MKKHVRQVQSCPKKAIGLTFADKNEVIAVEASEVIKALTRVLRPGGIMTISERILKVMKERRMTQAEFAKQVGIATSTICECMLRRRRARTKSSIAFILILLYNIEVNLTA